MARIRTLNFLPEVFQTPSNSEFLAATLDQIVNPPSTQKIQGYVGSKLGYGINANDKYVPEPTKERVDYQLEPGVVFTKTDESIAKDFITYPGITNTIAMQGGITDDNNRLYQSQFYSWDSFCDLDKLINYNQYYWLPDGPPAVTVSNSTIYQNENFIVTDLPSSYQIGLVGSSGGSINPTLTLLRGGTYTFAVNQDTQFWIQGEPGVSGYSLTQPNQPVRDIYGVSNNGASSGVVTFNVPAKDAQDDYEFSTITNIDVVSDQPFANINGQHLSSFQSIDGVTNLEGLVIMFYNDGVVNEQGYTSSYFNEVQYDTNQSGFVASQTLSIASCDTSTFTLASGTTANLVVGQTVTFSGTIFGNVTEGQVYFINNIPSSTTFTISARLGGANVTLTAGSGSMTCNVNQGLLEDGYYSVVRDNYYRVEYVGALADPLIRLVPAGTIQQDQKIVPQYGTQYGQRGFYKNIDGDISLIPYLSAPLNVLYYQDGTYPTKVGMIRLIESNFTNTLNVATDILGHKTYTARNGVVFTNGLKVQFDGDVIPSSYLQGQYYVQGVGTAIELVPVNELICPEKFTQAEYIPWDTLPYDIGNYEESLYIPVLPDYITIARNSISKNAWSRSNRWFHIDVINATASYNDNPAIVNIANGTNKAKRPIIEFYPNLKLFNSGTVGKKPVDFIDTHNTDALSTVPGSLNYYPDIEVYTDTNGTIFSQLTPATSTTITVPVNSVHGTIEEYMYVTDMQNVLPYNSQITSLTNDGVTYVMTVSWDDPQIIVDNTDTDTSSFVMSKNTVDNYALFSGARIVFAADNDINVRNKIYIAELSTITEGQPPVVTLTVAEDGYVYDETEIVISRGYFNKGLSYWYNAIEYIMAQEKLNVNQAPLFDIFDKNGISLGNNDYYTGTSFVGSTLFAYKVGSGNPDSILGFPVTYSAAANIGDISFDVSINSQTFNYNQNGKPITENINIGYVYNYTSYDTYKRQIGWETAVAPSCQYQVFYFDYKVGTTYLSCDIAALPALTTDEKGWPRVKVYYNNVYKEPTVDYTFATTSNTTTITLINQPTIDTPIQVLVLSDQVSNIAYYEVPINLTNNPLNQNLTTVNIGDLRPHYESIFTNAPNTTGTIFGANNYRDCGDILPYGTALIQNSASMVLPGAFLRSPAHNLFDALLFNSREYIIYKQLLVDTVKNSEYVQRYTPSQILDGALDQITAALSEENAFFYSDMLPNKTPYISNTYVFNNDLDHTVYPLSQVYDFSTASYNGVLVYLYRTVDNVRVEKQLQRGFDYVISSDSPSLRITTPLLNGDNIIIKEYNQTYGSYVPNTPTKLGLYPAYQPAVVLDVNYMTPTYFIRGHDGSYNKLYGDYDPSFGVLIDFRDQALLEFENRIYNNIKLSEDVVIHDYEVLPGYFRQGTATYTYDEFLVMYTPNFLNWVGQNRLDYKTQYFTKNNEYTYNYSNSSNKLDQEPILQGYWRGVYQYFYDTVTPDSTPWEMLGFTIMPDWWTSRYGPAPYTSNNLILWADLEAGYVYNNGAGYVVPELARPGLSKIIPVDSAGNLVAPFVSVMGNYNPSTFQKDWKVGDMGPVELSYRRSSTWPFDLMRLFALTRPAEFYNLGVDLDNYNYNAEFNQYLVNDRSHLVINNIQVYGNGTAKTSYINWIVDYEKQQGIDATTNITTMLNNMDVRLVYRLAGFSDKSLLDFFVEKGSPTAKNSSLMIPDESYSVLLYDNQAFDKIMFSGVIIQQNRGYWTVYGNSQTFAYFEVLNPKYNGQYQTLSVLNLNAKVTNEYETTTTFVPYGSKFYTAQEVAQFLLSYGAFLESQGMIFNDIQNGVHVTWSQMVLEFLYWTQQGWEIGSIITLNPAAQDMNINKVSSIVQPLTIHNQNFILNQNLYPIKLNDLCITRDGTNFNVHTLNAGDTMAYAQYNISNFEHGIVFDNVTLFNDTIYSTVTGLRQDRIYVRGVKTAEWDGTVNAYGFILNQDNVQEFDKFVKYTKGVIVKYKNKYWTSLTVIEPSGVFNELEWKEINYNDVQKGMLPNASTRAYESTLYYDIYEANLESDADLLGFSLIGYRPRDYLALVDLTDVAQVQVYKNMIKNKGTKNAVDAFRGANLPQGGIKYDVYENWAIQSGTYGGVLNENFVDFRVNQNLMTGDPSIVSLTNGVYTEGAMQEVNIANLYNYGTQINDPNILNTVTLSPPNTLYPSAGYVNYDDVKMASYFYAGLPYAVDTYNKIIPIQSFYVGEYLWLANFKERWEVYRWKTIGQVLSVKNNMNQTATITFNKDHNLKKNDPMSIINFATNVDGYYLVVDVVNLREVIINLNFIGTGSNTLQGRGLGFSFESHRVSNPSDIAQFDLTENEFIKNTFWVDDNYDGSWAVYRKSINYLPQGQLESNAYGTYGSSVAYNSILGYLVGDSENGNVIRYSYNDNSYNAKQTLTGATSYGTSIAHAGNIVAISQPTSTPSVKLYVLNPTVLTNQLIPYQSAITAPGGVTDWGSNIALSDDSNWLYISDTGHAKVYVYRKQNIPMTAGYFVPGETYVITDLGNDQPTVNHVTEITDSASAIYPAGVAYDSSNNVYTMCYDNDNGGSYLLKYNSLGEVVFQKKYNLTLLANELVVDENNNLYTNFDVTSTNETTVLAKISSVDGTIIWQKVISDASHDITPGSLAYASGYVYQTVNRALTGSNTYTIVSKYNATTGALVWQRKLNAPADTVQRSRSIDVDSSNNVYLAVYDVTNTNGYVVKYNSSGAIQWQKKIAGLEYTNFISVAYDNLVLTSHDSSTAIIMKLNPSTGAIIWQRYLGELSGGTEFAYSSTTDSAGNIYFVGEGNYGVYGDQLIAKFDTNGNLLFQRTLNSSDTVYEDNFYEGRTGIVVKNNLMLTNGFTLVGPIVQPTVAQLPSDGSLTGIQGSWTYSASDFTVGTSAFSVVAGDLTDSLETYTVTNGSITNPIISTLDSTTTDFVNTDFTTIGAVENKVGITFVATGVGAGTGSATQITYKYSTYIDGSPLTVDDIFGKSIATTYTGNNVVIGAPNVDYSGSIINWGKAYVYARTEQNVEAPYNSVPYAPQSFNLAWAPNNLAGKASTSITDSKNINVSDTSDLAVNMPVMFAGTDFGITGLKSNKIYYVAEINSSTKFSLKASRSTSSVLSFNNQAGLTFTAYAQSNPLYVKVNGVLVDDINYATISNTFYYLTNLTSGDIVNINDSQFQLIESFNSNYTNRTDIQYGTSVDITTLGSDIVVGSPYEIDSDNNEGAVYSYVNAGAKYGVVIGTNTCTVTTTRNILLNGFLVTLSAGNASSIATQINNAKINNIVASSTVDNKLILQLINFDLSPVDQKLLVTTFDSSALTELGINVYANTQIILCPHEKQATQFGTTVKINEQKSLLASAVSGSRYEGTVFDFTDDENLDNDTVFDNNATQFVDTYPNAGAVYMFDYLSNYNESVSNPGAYVYAQSVNDNSTDYGYNPGYGLSLEFNENVVMVGSPNYLPVTVGGKAVIFNNSVGVTDWYEYRQSAPIVDINKIQNTQLYSASTNNTLVNFDYPDPLQDKLLGAARENLDYVTGVDPANYNVNYVPQSGMIWGLEQVGKMWFNTTNVRWMNYHQNDVVYNSRHWAQVFPGSDVAVYTWIVSYVLPVNYQGPGIPYDVNQYVVGTTINATGIAVPVYYFWVRNSNIIFDKLGKTLSDSIVASYIANPRISGVPFMAPLLPNTFAMYNSGTFFNGTDTVFHIGFANGVSNDIAHTEYTLIRTDYADDFLPGFPTQYSRHINEQSIFGNSFVRGYPYSLYAKMLDSMSGCDQSGHVVPNPLLPLTVQQGVLNNPRQSFFYNRYLALNNYLNYANNILNEYPIVEMREDLSFLFTSGEYYNTTDYWEYVNWYLPGYNNSTKTTIQVPIYGDLSTLSVSVGTLVKVEKNGAGKYEIYRYDGSGVWTRVGLQNGTIQFKNYLWDYAAGKLGFSGNFFDVESFDTYPSEETRNIIRALNEQIYTGELLIHRNKSLILLFDYIQAETIESQNYLPWINKTSLVDVSHSIRELKPYEVYKTDDQVFLSQYLNEVKPYHVVIKDYLFTYTGTDVFEGDITDFDVPATYNSTYQEFISPEIVYTTGTNSDYQYTYNDNIWQTAPYTQWYQNYGLTYGTPQYSSGVLTGYVGEPNYPITKLASYVTRSTKYMLVENANGLPTNGVLQIGDEKISYSYVDRSVRLLGGLTRGVHNTPISDHLPTAQIYIDLPAVIVLNGGRGYTEPPRVTAVIDTNKYPAPTEAAVFEAIMSLDTVLEIKVINPGKGYVVLPDVVIEPASIVTFTNTNIVSAFHTLSLFAPQLRTGDVVQYKAGTGAGTGRLMDGEWYYINVLESVPNTIVSFYTTYSDALNDTHRLPITDIGTSTGMTLNLGAKATSITQSTPTRENNISIKFDRTSYESQIKNWEAGTFYGAYYAGSYYNTDKLTSSKVTLESTAPDINDILASAHAVVFDIADITNEEQLTWSSFVRIVKQTLSANNAIRLKPLDGNNPDLSELEPNASGTTNGFYVNMPIKFDGQVIGGIVNDQTYYVAEILNEIDFTISETIDGPVKTLSSDTASIPMYCYTGQVVDQAIITSNYPGILKPTTTTSVINSVTIPLSAIGTGGTNGFYPGVSLYFTATDLNEEVFGGIIENQVYYVNTIIDEQTVTLSETDVNVLSQVDDAVFTNPSNNTIYSTTVTATSSTGNKVTLGSTSDFAINDPIIFTGTTFGNIVAGALYYVSTIVDSTHITISESINGTVFTLSNASGTATVTNQKNTVKLTDATGLMSMNVALPVSPGQVDGQKFEFYQTSQQYPNITDGTQSNLLQRSAYAAIGTNFSVTNNIVAVDDTTWFYVNMPIQFQSSFGGLSASTTYYIKDYSGCPLGTDPETYTPNIYLIADHTIAGLPLSPGSNKITCASGYDTSQLYVDMGITFSGVGLGGINIGQQYFVSTIVDSTHFTISEIAGGDELILTDDSGTMAGTGSPYIKVSATKGGSVFSLTTQTLVSPVEFDQVPTSDPTFSLSYILGGYSAIIESVGSGFAITNIITIPGTEVGGTSPANDVTMEVNTIDSDGGITSLSISGTPAGTTKSYYLKIRGSTQFEVYENSLLTVPVSGLDFAYSGFTTTTATSATASNDRITVTSSADFNLYDPVVFTGTIFASEITLGQTYYIKSKPTSTTVTISSTIDGTTLNISSDSNGSMTMAKAGSFMFLSEPFYFAPSIIRYNNRLYECLVSNNDREFVIGKWALVDPGDRKINAMDRVVGYYQPTVNMPGKDLTQLFSGVTYPNATYKGNDFEPDMQFDLDVVLQDQKFYPTNVQINGIVYTDGYYAAGNLTGYSALIYSIDGTNWIDAQLTHANINLTDIVYANGTYIMTSTNKTTPILRSTNGREWSTNGYFTPWGSTGWSTDNYDMTSLDIGSLSLESAAYYNGWIAIGDNIIHSNDTYTWTEVKTFPAGRDYQLYGITVANTAQFSGVVAVGKGSKLVFVDNFAEQVQTDLITYSTDGLSWNDVTPVTTKSFYGVAANNTTIIAVGENGVIYYSSNPNSWYGLNEASVSTFSSTNYIISISQSGLQVNDKVRFNNSFSSIVAETDYYVKSVLSPTLITISDTLGGSTKTLSAGTVPAGTIIYSYDDTASLRDIVYANNTWVAVGDSGLIKTSTDGVVWTTQTSSTTQNLNGVSYIQSMSQFITVGDNNVILTSDDNGVTWVNVSLFETAPAVHTVKGADFPYGYGPEELVPGVVRDNLAMQVYTRPGTDWPSVEYAHVGYNVKSYEVAPITDGQTIYNFDTDAEYLAGVFVQKLDAATKLGTTLYPGIDYDYDWQTKQVILNTPLTLVPLEILRVDIYEVGNGQQLVKSCTDVDPIRLNSTTGFNEIYVNCNYTGTIYQGSGVIKPGTYDQSIIASQTISGSNRIVMDNVSTLTLGEPITFSGDLLGGLAANTTYFVKSISQATSSITISNVYDVNTGTAGATIPVTDDTGTMYVNVSIGSDQVWSQPFMLNNGVQLVQGYSSQVTQTVASNNSIIANSTAGMAANCKVTFSNQMFGGVLQPLTTYYVKDVLSATAFTVSATPGGTVITLTDALGGAEYISYDYAFGIQPNGTSAKIVFPENDLNVATNYIVYSLLGETEPEQYGFTMPEVQLFVGDNSTTVFNLTNYVGGTNDDNAIVEINGLRKLPSTYTIDFNANTITFVTAPANNANISVTTYNSTQRQYFNTQTNTGLTVSSITNVNNTIAPPLAVALATSSSSVNNRIAVTSTSGFVINQRVEFHGTSFGGIATDGTVYYVKTIVDSTHFTISATPAGTVKVLTTDSGAMTVTVGGQDAILITTSSAPGFSLNDIVRIDGVVGSTQLNNNTYYVRPITTTTFELYEEPYSASLSAVNFPVTSCSTYVSNGYIWKASQLYITDTTATRTYASSPTYHTYTIVVGDTSNLISGTSIYFSSATTSNGDSLFGNLVHGTEYFVSTIYSATEFSISDTRYGDEFVLTNATGSINATQWSNYNVDRLWVTVNGYRVPSSKLRLNDFNELSILTPISSSDNIIITSMVPSATPNGELYINFVDEIGIPSVYRVPAYAKTYLVEPVYELSTEIWVNDINALTIVKNQNATTPASVDGYYTIGISGNKRQIKTVRVDNITTGLTIEQRYIDIILVDDNPALRIDVGSYISEGDQLSFTIYEGNTVYINGEQISYTGVDYDFYRLTGITRGVNGTSNQGYIANNTSIIGLLDQNRMNDVYYDQTWNSYVYNETDGDPLQISDTVPAYFLNPDYT